jgi:hypothetical protein
MLYRRIGIQRHFRPFDHDLATVVATHAIDCYAHKKAFATRPKNGASRRLLLQKAKSATGKTAALLQNRLTDGFDVQNLAAFVKAARRANPVGESGSRALRANAQLRQDQNTVVCAPHPLTAARRFTLGYAHIFISA